MRVTIITVIGLLRSSLCELHIRRGNTEIMAILTCQS
ncbi:Hok/Gef family protein [Erwinia sp. V71]